MANGEPGVLLGYGADVRTRLLTLLTLCACGPSPEALEASDYVHALQPYLMDNALLARRMLTVASDVFNGGIDGKRLEQRWDTEVVPLAEHLCDQARLLEVQGLEWSARHNVLTNAWCERAEAYRDIAGALRLEDTALWEHAKSQANAAKLDEESWFKDTNGYLSAFGLSLDQFPG